MSFEYVQVYVSVTLKSLYSTPEANQSAKDDFSKWCGRTTPFKLNIFNFLITHYLYLKPEGFKPTQPCVLYRHFCTLTSVFLHLKRIFHGTTTYHMLGIMIVYHSIFNNAICFCNNFVTFFVTFLVTFYYLITFQLHRNHIISFVRLLLDVVSE